MIALSLLLLSATGWSGVADDKPPVWEQIWDQPDVAVIYVDRGSIAEDGDLRSIATRTTYQGELPDDNISERIRIEEFDCAQRRSRLRRTTIIRTDGRAPVTVELAPANARWAPVEADSLGDRKRRIACGR